MGYRRWTLKLRWYWSCRDGSMGNSRPEDLSAGPQDRVKAKRSHTLSAIPLQIYRQMEGRGRKDPRYSRGPSVWLTWWRDPGLHKRNQGLTSKRCPLSSVCAPRHECGCVPTREPTHNTAGKSRAYVGVSCSRKILALGSLLCQVSNCACIQLTCQVAAIHISTLALFPPRVMTYFCEKIQNQLNSNPKQEFVIFFYLRLRTISHA